MFLFVVGSARKVTEDGGDIWKGYEETNLIIFLPLLEISNLNGVKVILLCVLTQLLLNFFYGGDLSVF